MTSLFPASVPVKGNARGSGYERNADDWYVEPPWMVESLLDVEDFSGGIWDPCCGIGVIPRVCQQRGFDAVGSDLVDRGFGMQGDFFRSQRRADNIISNPPFKHLEPFILRALKRVERKVAVVARFLFAEAESRRALFLNTPLKRIWLSPSRAAMPPGQIAIEGLDPTHTPDFLSELSRRSLEADAWHSFAWFVWERGYEGETLLGWLPLRPRRRPTPRGERLL